MTWQEVIIKLVDMITEDKLMAMLCLTYICSITIAKYPITASLPVITAIVGSIGGFVVGRTMSKKDS